jgi:hypothetical protein
MSDDIGIYGRKVYSQGDEDGVIAEIFRRIGTTNKIFIEFGAGSGFENNTRLLLERGWRGLWIEANPDHAGRIRRVCRRSLRLSRLTLIEAFITTENINQLILSCGLPVEVDFLSIDIDGNDYHVLDAITVVRPRVICLEYTRSKPPPLDWVMPYAPAHQWDGRSDTGASLVAFEQLLSPKGYSLVGTPRHSTNAFFVRDEFVPGQFEGPFTAGHFFRAATDAEILGLPRETRFIFGILRQKLRLG